MEKISSGDALALVNSWMEDKSPVGIAGISGDLVFFSNNLLVTDSLSGSDGGAILLARSGSGIPAEQFIVGLLRASDVFLATRNEIAGEMGAVFGAGPGTLPPLIGACLRLTLGESVVFLWETVQ